MFSHITYGKHVNCKKCWSQCRTLWNPITNLCVCRKLPVYMSKLIDKYDLKHCSIVSLIPTMHSFYWYCDQLLHWGLTFTSTLSVIYWTLNPDWTSLNIPFLSRSALRPVLYQGVKPLWSDTFFWKTSHTIQHQHSLDVPIISINFSGSNI